MITTISKAKKYFENCDKKGLAIISKTHSFDIPITHEVGRRSLIVNPELNYNTMSDTEIIMSANMLKDVERYQSSFRGMSINRFLDCINNI